VLVNIASFFGVTTDFLLGVSGGKTVDVSDYTANKKANQK